MPWYQAMVRSTTTSPCRTRSRGVGRDGRSSGGSLYYARSCGAWHGRRRGRRTTGPGGGAAHHAGHAPVGLVDQRLQFGDVAPVTIGQRPLTRGYRRPRSPRGASSPYGRSTGPDRFGPRLATLTCKESMTALDQSSFPAPAVRPAAAAAQMTTFGVPHHAVIGGRERPAMASDNRLRHAGREGLPSLS